MKLKLSDKVGLVGFVRNMFNKVMELSLIKQQSQKSIWISF